MPARIPEAARVPESPDPLVGRESPEGQTSAATPTRELETVSELAPPSTEIVVRAVDAFSGEAVSRFWVRRDAFTEAAAEVERFRSDPATGQAHLQRSPFPMPLSIRAQGYEIGQGMEPSSPDATVEIALDRATTIRGIVRDGTSAPLKAAQVFLEWYGDSPEALDPLSDPLSYHGVKLIRTDEGGRFAFANVPPGVYATRVEIGGAVHQSDRVRVETGIWVDVDHWLEEHSVVVANLTNPDGEPAARSLILLFPFDADEEDAPAARGYTDDEGRARIGPLTEGPYRVQVVSNEGTALERTVEITSSSPSEVDLVIVLSHE